MIDIYAFSKEKGVRKVPDISALPFLLKDDSESVWVDLETPTEEDAQILSSLFGFHPLAIEDCLAESHLPKLDDFGEYLFWFSTGRAGATLKELSRLSNLIFSWESVISSLITTICHGASTERKNGV